MHGPERLVQVKPDATALRSEVLLYQLLYSLAPDRISRLMAGSTSKHLNVKDLRQLPVIVPPKPQTTSSRRSYPQFEASKPAISSSMTIRH